MSHSNPIKGFAHVGIRVFDLTRSRTFYEKLGFEFVMGPIGEEPVAIMKHPSGVEINLVINAHSATEANVLQDVSDKFAGYTHIALAVNDVDETARYLEGVGIPIKAGPVTYPTGARGLFIRDPDLNTIEFHQPSPTA